MSWQDILHYFLKKVIIPTNTVLIFCEADKIIHSFSLVWERDCHNGILIIVLQCIGPKNVGKLLDEGKPVLEEVKILVEI